MIVTMDMCSVKVESDYTSEVMCAGWNPVIAMMQDRAAEIAAQLIHYQFQCAGGMPVDVAAMDAETFLERMYSSQR
ncbi:hypothetical protein SCD_n01241 [Sulfuricella denitrificans skB26]|uniref:Uncharacterized protein n=1 Tax=Sulfuricella denitrificans (strain DSM 22764 / NBRC 105220 / skB26) TaxID=1163617 RepID=S6AA15_SULDS|nr:hypothetical protein [Sulfuricella denitrificans]BAN35070.1 hypothetical protein SCD_n01241 [Sulfuricella denitrificans skB26]